MKKLLNILIAFCVVFGVQAQNIPNGEFEKWEKRDHYKADKYYSYNSTVYRTTDAKEGKYAIRLENRYSETGNGSRGYVTNYRSNDKANFGGVAFDGEPFSLVFWSKHDLAVGDTARIYVDFRYRGSYKGRVDFRFHGSTQGQFVRYSVPITWSGARSPDTVRITLYSKVRSKIQGDGYVIYDDVHFENIGYRSPEIDNGNFEDWTNVGLDYPTSWNSVDLRNYDNSRNFYTKPAVAFQNEEKFLGESALAVRNYWSGSNPRVGYAYIGPKRDDFSTPAFAFRDTFKFLQGYYKYLPDREDTALLNFRTYVNQTRRSNNYLSLPKAEEWTFFSMPLTYADQYTPDSASFLAYSAYYKDTVGENTVLYLDNLDLTMEPTEINLSIPEIDYYSGVYPNPVVDKLSVKTDKPYTSATVVSLMGISSEVKITNTAIDMTNFHPGLYFVTLWSDSYRSQTFKIIKQ